MVDKTLILRKLAEVDQCLSQIKEYAGISVEEYQSNWKTQRIVERTLQMMIETCVDIAGHIISDKAFRTPVSTKIKEHYKWLKSQIKSAK